MVDTAILNELIDNSGKKRGYIAKKIGITRQSLRKKVLNITEFTTDEVTVLCEELHITKLSDKERIFFAPNVADSGNKG